MIYALAPSSGVFGLADFVAEDAPELAGFVSVRSYEAAFTGDPLPLGAYIFTAIDQLTHTERELVQRLQDRLASVSPGLPRLNHPARWRGRGALLEVAADAGLNPFRVTRAGAPGRRRRFPVFLRSESQHTGSLSPLLYDQAGVHRAVLAALLRGHRYRDLLVVEYCHTADGDGVFRKYSAMVIGAEIVPRSLTASREWVTKVEGRITSPAAAAADRAYVMDNPHAAWLRDVAALGGVEYGRIDYGIRDGRPVLWEINTNPTIGSQRSNPMPNPWPAAGPPAGNRIAYRKIGLALEALDRVARTVVHDGAELSFPVSGAERRRLARERARRERFLTHRTALGVAVAPLRQARLAVTRALRA